MGDTKSHTITIVSNGEEVEVELNSMLFDTLKEVILSEVRKTDLRNNADNVYSAEEMNLLIKKSS